MGKQKIFLNDKNYKLILLIYEMWLNNDYLLHIDIN